MLILVTLDNKDMHKASPYIHPNPTDGIITVRSNSTISSWTLFDMQGKALMAGTPDTKEVRIDLSNLPSSVYFLKISYIDAESVGLPDTVTRKILVK